MIWNSRSKCRKRQKVSNDIGEGASSSSIKTLSLANSQSPLNSLNLLIGPFLNEAIQKR
ncbi:hypothetical protein Plhal710r2_c036g0130501 [Plasmopara halstedii]